MSLSYFRQVGFFKSSLRTIAAFLLRSRATQKRRADDKAEEIGKLREIIGQHERTIANAKQERGETNLLVTQHYRPANPIEILFKSALRYELRRFICVHDLNLVLA